MPPKKKKVVRRGGKKGGRKVAVIDGVAVAEMNREQLEGHVWRLQKEIEREREERNFFQLERDKISSFWDVSKKEIQEKEAELKVKDRNLEEAEERHQAEIKVYKQKVKHVMLEYQQHLSSQREDSMTALKIAEEGHRQEESSLLRDKRDLKVNLKEEQLAHQEAIEQLKLKHNQDASKLRHEYESKIKELMGKNDKRMQMVKDELDLRRKREVHEIEERKNQHIEKLIKNHDKAFGDMKNYYNDITQNNLALISTLKEQMETVRKKEERMEKQVEELLHENRQLAEPLQTSQKELQYLQNQLTNYEKDKATLQNSKRKLKSMEEEIKQLKWENEVLSQQFTKVENERDILYSKFILAIQEVEQKISFKNMLLEKKISSLKDVLLKREVEMNEALASTDLEAFSLVTKKLEDLLHSRSAVVKDLQFELAKVNKVDDTTKDTSKIKLKHFGAPPESVSSLDVSVTGQKVAASPKITSDKEINKHEMEFRWKSIEEE